MRWRTSRSEQNAHQRSFENTWKPETQRRPELAARHKTSLCRIRFISFPRLPQTVKLVKVTGGTNRPPNRRSDMSGCSGSSPCAACSEAIGAVVSLSGVEKRTCDGGSVITRPGYANRGGSADLAKRLSVLHLKPSFPRLNIHQSRTQMEMKRPHCSPRRRWRLARVMHILMTRTIHLEWFLICWQDVPAGPSVRLMHMITTMFHLKERRKLIRESFHQTAVNLSTQRHDDLIQLFVALKTEANVLIWG